MEPRISIVTLGVKDLSRSYDFYHYGLQFPTTGTPTSEIIFFQTSGTCLALYPVNKLAEDIAPELSPKQHGFSGITIAHNTKKKSEVNKILEMAARAGGTIVKPAQTASWGGYSGYFSDPDGHYWEFAFSEDWQFNKDGSLIID